MGSVAKAKESVDLAVGAVGDDDDCHDLAGSVCFYVEIYRE
jgi:hypothetical protein